MDASAFSDAVGKGIMGAVILAFILGAGCAGCGAWVYSAASKYHVTVEKKP